VPQSKAAGLTLAGDWTSRKTTTSPQAAAEKNVDHHRCLWRRRGYAAHLFATGARLELLGGSSDPLEQRIRIHAAVAVVALLIVMGWL